METRTYKIVKISGRSIHHRKIFHEVLSRTGKGSVTRESDDSITIRFPGKLHACMFNIELSKVVRSLLPQVHDYE